MDICDVDISKKQPDLSRFYQKEHFLYRAKITDDDLMLTWGQKSPATSHRHTALIIYHHAEIAC